MRTIAIEEHFSTPIPRSAAPDTTSGGTTDQYMVEVGRKLADVGEGRLADMNAAGIDVQVLSLSAVEGPGRAESGSATARARDANDFLADTVSRHPRALRRVRDPRPRRS